jgi:penicillin-binding protein 2
MQHQLENQSLRKPRVPAVRGNIFDRDGQALVENRPQYNAVLYLEEMRSQFTNEYYSHEVKEYIRDHPGTSRVPARLIAPLRLEADYRVVSNLSYQAAAVLEQPMTLDRERFGHFYTNYTFMPLQILTNLNSNQVAIFSEKLSGQAGLDLERQPVVWYPHQTTAAHLLGYVVRTGEDRKYLAPGYKGTTGIEGAFDKYLKGEAGTNLVLVNNEGYRQHEEILSAHQAGDDIYLTISLPLQREAEKALAQWGVRGAAVVMDARTGDILAMASVPAFDPNEFVTGVTPARWEQLNDARLQPQLNRATYDAYPPGSTFKIITTLACLESGVMDVNEVYTNTVDAEDPIHGVFAEKRYRIKDTAPPGEYRFESAFYHSSNGYFCHYGLKAGLRKLLEVARRFHLGEKAGFVTGEEVAGRVPQPEQAGKTMPLSSAPYVAIGQEITVTPLQMTVLVAAIANGGTIFWPRVVKEIRAPGADGAVEESFPEGRVRDQVHLDPQHLQILRHAMLEDVEHPGVPSNAYKAFHAAGGVLEQAHFQVAGKTGTAQVKSPALDYRHVTWFDSYGPYDDPRYAVVVMVVDGGSGGGTCAPVAEKIYEEIVKMEKTGAARRAPSRN